MQERVLTGKRIQAIKMAAHDIALDKKEMKTLLRIKRKGEIPVDQVDTSIRKRLRDCSYIKQADNKSSVNRQIVLALTDDGVSVCNEYMASKRAVLTQWVMWVIPVIISLIALWKSIHADNIAHQAISITVNNNTYNQDTNAGEQRTEEAPIEFVVGEPNISPETMDP